VRVALIRVDHGVFDEARLTALEAAALVGQGRRARRSLVVRVHAVVTTRTLPPEEVWRTDHGRADIAHRRKALTHAFGAEGNQSEDSDQRPSPEVSLALP